MYVCMYVCCMFLSPMIGSGPDRVCELLRLKLGDVLLRDSDVTGEREEELVLRERPDPIHPIVFTYIRTYVQREVVRAVVNPYIHSFKYIEHTYIHTYIQDGCRQRLKSKCVYMCSSCRYLSSSFCLLSESGRPLRKSGTTTTFFTFLMWIPLVAYTYIHPTSPWNICIHRESTPIRWIVANCLHRQNIHHIILKNIQNHVQTCSYIHKDCSD